MEVLLIATVLTLAGAQESQLEGPGNTLSIVGSAVTLKCLSPSRNCIEIDWQKYIPGASPMTVFKSPGYIVRSVDRDRYSVDNSSGCDLVIKNVQLMDAGRFICSAIFSSSQTTKTAYLVILETQPKCTINANENDTVEGDGVQLKCEVTYNGTNRASMIWKGVTDAPAVVESGSTICRSYSVVASQPEVSSFTCETSFPLEGIDVFGRPIIGLATNIIPNANCSTSDIKLLYSVRNVILSPSLSNYPPGTVITCTAKGHPSPTFKWQEMENIDIWMDNQYGSKFTMTNLSSKKYRCVAMNVVRGRSHNATSSEIQFDNTDPVRDVTLSQSLTYYPPGSIITCTAKGHPSPTFKWQEMENSETWIDTHYGSKFTMTDVSSKRYRCVAMNFARGENYNATSHEILVNNTECLGIGIGIGFGIGFLVAILIATVVIAILVKVRCLKVQPLPAKMSPDGDDEHMGQEMSTSSHQRLPKAGAPLSGEHESTYASLGEDKDANEYASLELKQKATPKK